MYRRRIILGALLSLSLISLDSLRNLKAVDVGFDGYFRSRGNYFYNLQMDRSKTPHTRGFTDLRFRLNPSFYITDKIRVKSSLNFIDGVLGDNPFHGGAYNNPATTTNTLLDPNGTEPTIGRTTTSANGGGSHTVYGGAYLPDGMVTSEDLKPIQLRRAWAEFDIPYGTIKIGRMPNDFGLGIFANAGDRPDQEFGSTRDRIMFDTSFGPYYVRPGAGWLVEGSLDQAADDFYEYFLIFGRKSERQDIGFYLSYNGQDAYRPDLQGVTTGQQFINAETAYWAFDFYFHNQFDRVNVASEVVLFTGKMAGREALAVNGVLLADWKWTRFSLLTEAGYSSGTSVSDRINGDLKSVAFSRDYQVALIVFNEALPGRVPHTGSANAADNLPTPPHAGAISNAIYGRLKAGYEVASFYIPYANIVLPYAAKQADAAGKLYGIEYDIINMFPINHYLTAELDFGHFIPGAYYDNVSKSQSVLLFRGGIVAKF